MSGRFALVASSAACLLAALCLTPRLPAAQPAALPFTFTNIARQAGLTAPTVYGGRDSNRYLLETTGCGVALIDYDRDGRLDIFMVNGTTLELTAATPANARRGARRRGADLAPLSQQG